MASIINASSTGSGGIVQTADASGVLQLQSNGNIAVTVDTSSNVGVGTASPSARLSTQLTATAAYASTAPSASNCTASFVNPAGHVSGGVFVGYQLNISGDSQNRIGYIGGVSESASNQALSLVFGTNTGAGDRTEKMRLSSAGYLNIPNQPAFSQIGSASTTVNTTGDLVFTSSNVWSASASTLLNTGSNFNVANGRFTAPVSGNYLFIVSVACAFSSGYFYLYFFKNGAALTNANRNFSQNTQAVTQSLQMIIPLVAGDYITCATNNNNTGFSLYAPYFCGNLIG